MSTPKTPKKLKSYTIAQKLEVIELIYELNHNASECERRTGIDRRTIGKWLKKEVTLKSSSAKKDTRKLRPRICWYPILEEKLKD